MTRWLVVSTLVIGCKKEPQGGAGVDDTGTSPSGPTYYGDVRSILDQNCARCHTTDGLAPSFDDAETVVAYAPLIHSYTEAGLMPPPTSDPTCADYANAETYFLSDDEKATLAAWDDAGAPLGDRAEAPEPHTPTTLAPYDLALKGALPYTPEYLAGDINAYRCWAFDIGNTGPRFVSGFEAVIDQLVEVHHVVFYLDTTGASDTKDGDGFDCDGLGMAGWDYMHAWGPGAPPLQLQDGQGIRLPAQSRVIVQVHYYDNGAATPDNTGYGLVFEDEVDTEVFALPLGVEEFTIPAGDAAHEETMVLQWPGSWGNFTLLGVWPHMHQLGSGFDFSVSHTSGEESCVVDMNGYDFHNQVMVMLTTPFEIAPGDEVTLTCHYDNSAENPNQQNDPPLNVTWGEGTDDEMCYGFAYGIFH